jgi:hypothetical protein
VQQCKSQEHLEVGALGLGLGRGFKAGDGLRAAGGLKVQEPHLAEGLGVSRARGEDGSQEGRGVVKLAEGAEFE